jgi:hypothetical protein
MAYTPVDHRLGIQPIATMNVPNSALQSGQSAFFNQEHPLGTVVKGYDPIYGEGEFIYLQGASAQVTGSVVTFGGYGAVGGGPVSQSQYQAALAPSTANLDRRLAVAMAAFPSGSPATAYGWFQISGQAVVATNGTAASAPAPVYLAGSGQVTTTQANGKQVLNAQSVTTNGTPAGNFVVLEINRPFAQGQTV